MEKPRFVIEASEVESMEKDSGLSVFQILPSLVKSAQNLARPSISKYHVGTVGLGSTGRIFLGANLEFPGLPLNQSVHAEQFLITNLAINGEPQLKYLAVSAAPCGHCRQFLQEIRDAPNIQLFITSAENEEEGDEDLGQSDESKFKPLSQFLPHRFGPDDLLEKKVPLLLEPHENGLLLVDKLDDDDDDDNLCNNGGSDKFELLGYEALEAANKSHAPYSGCPSGVAFMDDEGKIYRGSYMESAAYNPSLGPVQAAIVAYIAGGGNGYEKIVAGVLVEKEGAVVKQEHTAKMFLQVVSPKCEFKVVYCKGSGKKSATN